MGLNTDATAIQFRMLNASKGPSVRAPRAQCDKTAYRTRMKMVLETAPAYACFREMWSNCSSMENSRQREPLLLWAAPSMPAA
nr:FAD-dependent oxidoreductase [Akkermansia muciniphila]